MSTLPDFSTPTQPPEPIVEVLETWDPKFHWRENVMDLVKRGAHFLQVKSNKSPWGSWTKPLTTKETIQCLAKGGLLGLVPWSLQWTVADVDHGNPGTLADAFPPFTSFTTRTEGHAHLFYADHVGRSNANFEYRDVRGQIRGERGYVVLWPQEGNRFLGLQRLHRALSGIPANKHRFPERILSQAGHEGTGTARQAKTVPYPLRPITDPAVLFRTFPGSRNETLFQVLLGWAFGQRWKRRDVSNDAVRYWVRFHAYKFNHRMPEPLPWEEVEETIVPSVSRYTMQRLDRQSQRYRDAQQRRAVKRFYGSARAEVLRSIVDRDASICEDFQAGKSQQSLAREWGISRRLVYHILKREGVLKST